MKYSIFEGSNHMGDVNAPNESEAMRIARKHFPNVEHLRVIGEGSDGNADRVNPISLHETRKAIDGMSGKNSGYKFF